MTAKDQGPTSSDVERMRKLVDREVVHYRDLIGRGKGAHGEPGYVRDDTWNYWSGRLAMAEDIARDIALLSLSRERETDDINTALDALPRLLSALKISPARSEHRRGDGCTVPGCCRKGAPGNENVIDGNLVCDYCHAARSEPPFTERALRNLLAALPPEAAMSWVRNGRGYVAYMLAQEAAKAALMSSAAFDEGHTAPEAMDESCGPCPVPPGSVSPASDGNSLRTKGKAEPLADSPRVHASAGRDDALAGSVATTQCEDRASPGPQDASNKAVVASLPSAGAGRDSVLDALRKAAEQFRFYEREHMTKANNAAGRGGVGESNASIAKAMTNREFAELCERSLKQEGGGR